MKTKQIAKLVGCTLCQGEVALCSGCADLYEMCCQQSGAVICLSCDATKIDLHMQPYKATQAETCGVLYEDGLKYVHWCKNGTPYGRYLDSSKMYSFDAFQRILRKSGVEVPMFA